MASTASAQMVLVMGRDGALRPSPAQEAFSRSYVDGIGQSPAPGPHLLRENSAPPAPYAPPRPDILAAIDDTALRYAGHPGLRAAGLTVTGWRHLYRATIEIESAYDPEALSHAGAIGLGQLMPATAASLGVDPHDWRDNLDGAARYLARMLEEFGDVRLALAAYNAGPTIVRQQGGIPAYAETRAHVRRVLAATTRLEGKIK